MKLTDLVIITKGACLTYIPVGVAIVEGLPKLEMTHIFGVPVPLVSLLVSASIAGASGLLAFLSTSFGSFMLARNGVDNPGRVPEIPKP